MLAKTLVQPELVPIRDYLRLDTPLSPNSIPGQKNASLLEEELNKRRFSPTMDDQNYSFTPLNEEAKKTNASAAEYNHQSQYGNSGYIRRNKWEAPTHHREETISTDMSQRRYGIFFNWKDNQGQEGEGYTPIG